MEAFSLRLLSGAKAMKYALFVLLRTPSMLKSAVSLRRRKNDLSCALHSRGRQRLILPHAIIWHRCTTNIYDLDPIDSEQGTYLIALFPLSVSKSKPYGFGSLHYFMIREEKCPCPAISREMGTNDKFEAD
jgi:hypothetical protein